MIMLDIIFAVFSLVLCVCADTTFVCRYGFGDAGKVEHNIPSGATLQYKIKLTAFEKVNMNRRRRLNKRLQLIY